MEMLSSHINELKAADAFSRQSIVFDQLYETNTFIKYKRKRVREHLEQHLKPKSHILELNCGTGQDAIYLSLNGHNVHATDLAQGMLAEAKRKTAQLELQNLSYEQCSFTRLEELAVKGPYDAVFSNFGGLNCTDDLQKVIHSFSPLLKEKGTVTLVIISKFCLWELLLLFTGKFKTAFRRFYNKGRSNAQVEGKSFSCWYYSPRQVLKYIKNDYELLSLEALCTIVPPSYIEHFPERYPLLFSLLKRVEFRLRDKWPFRATGDYFIITFRKC